MMPGIYSLHCSVNCESETTSDCDDTGDLHSICRSLSEVVSLSHLTANCETTLDNDDAGDLHSLNIRLC